MPNEFDPYANFPPTAGVNPGAFLEQIGVVLSMLGARNPEDALRMYVGLQGLQQHRQKTQMEQAKQMRQQTLAAQDRLGLIEFASEVQRVMRMRPRGGEGTPPTGTEGLRPLEQTGFGQPKVFQQSPQHLDPVTLQLLSAFSPSVMKMQMDPQTQTYWQSVGLAPPTPQTLISQQNADTAEHRAGIAEQFAGIRQQFADARDKEIALKEAIQGMQTELSKRQGENLEARTKNLGAKTDYTLGTTPGRVALLDEQVKAMQERFPVIAPMAEARLAGEKARTKKTEEETKWVAPKAQAGIQGQEVRTAATQKKIDAGEKSPKQDGGDKAVEAEAKFMRQLTDDKPGWFSAGKTAQQKALERIEKLAVMHPAYRAIGQRAFLQVFGDSQPTKKVFRFDTKGNPLQ